MIGVRHAVAAMTVLALACAAKPPADLPAPPSEPIDACDGAPGGEVSIHYLRAGGFAIVTGDEALLTAPFYSNPSFVRVGLGLPIAPDPERIPERPELLDGKRVAGVLVGHSHYDHLMDIPAVLEKWQLERVPTYSDSTGVNLLGNVDWEGPAFPVDESGGSSERAGQWIHPPARPGRHTAGSRFRVMPLRSEHAPHAQFGIKLFQGTVERGDGKPWNAYGWKEGQTWAYLIDVLADDGERVLLRIHYQDSASNPNLGWPPDELIAARPVDLVLFCAASFSLVSQHPQAVLETLRPRHAMASHWEDFSRDPGRPLRVVPLTDLETLVAKASGSLPGRISVPMPGQRIRFSVCSAASGAPPG